MYLTNEEKWNKAKQLLSLLNLNNNEYKKILDEMNCAMSKGLKKGSTNNSIKMYPTYVSRIPNGTESGKYLALDLGGINYRVLAINLSGHGGEPEISERTYSIPKGKLLGTGENVDYLCAETLANFLESYGMEESYKLGFTFSFPCEQKGLTNAKLIRWTKGFCASDVEGHNVAKLLQDAINKVGINVTCVAIVNDTVGTMASCALRDSRCTVGIIVGTGTNAAYLESRDRVETIEGNCGPQVVINTEWGAFGENGELDAWRTLYDKMIDEESLYPGKQLFEKMISGMYLGELVRHALLHLAKEGILFNGNIPDSIQKKNAVLTKYLTDVERDPPSIFYNTHYMLTADLNVPIVDPIDDEITRYVCELIAKRAAYLAGVGIACILQRMNKPEVIIGVDGSLFKFHPKFGERMTEMIIKLKPSNTKFYLRLSEDGSGKGAAAIAAAAAAAAAST